MITFNNDNHAWGQLASWLIRLFLAITKHWSKASRYLPQTHWHSVKLTQFNACSGLCLSQRQQSTWMMYRIERWQSPSTILLTLVIRELGYYSLLIDSLITIKQNCTGLDLFRGWLWCDLVGYEAACVVGLVTPKTLPQALQYNNIHELLIRFIPICGLENFWRARGGFVNSPNKVTEPGDTHA